MKAAEIRELSIEEMRKMNREYRRELAILRIKKDLGQLEDNSQFKKMRKIIAQLETIEAEKVRAEALAGSPPTA